MDMRWSPMMMASFMLHLAVFSVVFFVPGSFPTRRIEGVVYEVNLVEMPGGGPKPTGTSAPKAPEGKVLPQKETETKRIPPEKREEKPLVVAKRTLEKETPVPKKPETSPSELLDRAISKIEKKVQEKGGKEGDHLSKALSKLEKDVKGGGGTGGSGAQGMTGTMMQIYQMEVEEWIKSNWAYPVALDREKDLEVKALLTVRRDGAITKTQFIQQSSNALFDESVSRAIKRSDPLPPFPEGFKRSYEEIEITFNLKELQEQ